MFPSFIPTRARGIFGGPLDEVRVRAYWDSMSGDYAPGADRGLVRFFHGRQHRAALRLARVTPGARALDAGAGSGLLTRELVASGCDVTAVDSSPAMLDLLRGVTPNVMLSRLEDLELDPTFDVVMAIGVLNFVTTPEDTLRRLCAGVKPGGALVLQVTEWSALGLAYWLGYRARSFSPFLFTRRWLTDRARERGLEPAGGEHPLPHDLTVAFRRAA
jgi:2-polyprenyl-3-methyl-5-hydroxy-6-metoxy-1,4-benzoquinol methylase